MGYAKLVAVLGTGALPAIKKLYRHRGLAWIASPAACDAVDEALRERAIARGDELTDDDDEDDDEDDDHDNNDDDDDDDDDDVQNAMYHT